MKKPLPTIVYALGGSAIGMAAAFLLAHLVTPDAGKTQQAPEQQQAAKYEPRRLFEIDGCTMYRFYDGGKRYFSKCDTTQAPASFWRDAAAAGDRTGLGLKP